MTLIHDSSSTSGSSSLRHPPTKMAWTTNGTGAGPGPANAIASRPGTHGHAHSHRTRPRSLSRESSSPSPPPPSSAVGRSSSPRSAPSPRPGPSHLPAHGGRPKRTSFSGRNSTSTSQTRALGGTARRAPLVRLETGQPAPGSAISLDDETEAGADTPYGASASSPAGRSGSEEERDWFVSARGEDTEVDDRHGGGRAVQDGQEKRRSFTFTDLTPEGIDRA